MISRQSKYRMVEDALKHQQDYDRWFREQGELVKHEDVGRMLNQRYPG